MLAVKLVQILPSHVEEVKNAKLFSEVNNCVPDVSVVCNPFIDIIIISGIVNAKWLNYLLEDLIESVEQNQNRNPNDPKIVLVGQAK